MPSPGPMPSDIIREAIQQIPNDPMIAAGAVGLGAVAVGGRMSGRLAARKWARRAAKQDGYALPMFVRDERNVGRTERVGNMMTVPRTGSILALGATRSGKTETGKWIVEGMQADEDEPMVVYDHKDDYQQFFNEIGREYVKFSASGSTHTWNIFEEIEDAQDAGEVARSIFAEAEQAGGSSGAYFGPAARQVFTIALKYILAQAERSGRTRRTRVSSASSRRTTPPTPTRNCAISRDSKASTNTSIPNPIRSRAASGRTCNSRSRTTLWATSGVA